MGTKVAAAFSNIFIAKVETELLNKSAIKPICLETELLNKSAIKPICQKRYTDDTFSLWDTGREQITHFIEQANNHPVNDGFWLFTDYSL